MTAIRAMYGDAIKITQVHYVCCAAELGSFSRAAEVLGVSQPALSHGIATLERTMGAPLFHRSTTGVAPTALAERMLPHLQQMLASVDAVLVVASAASGRTQQPLRMGVSPLIHPGLIARAFQAARQSPPGALTLKEDDLANLRTDLRGRQLDLILVPAIPTKESYERLHVDTEPIHYLPEPSVAQWAPDQPIELRELSRHQQVMVGEACGLTPFIRSLFETSKTELTRYPGQADSYRSLEEWARLGLGGALMPKSRFQDPQQTRALHHRGLPVTIDYEALWLVGSTQTVAIATLLGAITNPAP